MNATANQEAIDVLLTALWECATAARRDMMTGHATAAGRRESVTSFAGAEFQLARATELVNRGAMRGGSSAAPSYCWIVPPQAEPAFVGLATELGVELSWGADANGNRQAWWGNGPREYITRTVG